MITFTLILNFIGYSVLQVQGALVWRYVVGRHGARGVESWRVEGRAPHFIEKPFAAF